jgi:hypothetical protein
MAGDVRSLHMATFFPIMSEMMPDSDEDFWQSQGRCQMLDSQHTFGGEYCLECCPGQLQVGNIPGATSVKFTLSPSTTSRLLICVSTSVSLSALPASKESHHSRCRHCTMIPANYRGVHIFMLYATHQDKKWQLRSMPSQKNCCTQSQSVIQCNPVNRYTLCRRQVVSFLGSYRLCGVSVNVNTLYKAVYAIKALYVLEDGVSV